MIEKIFLRQVLMIVIVLKSNYGQSYVNTGMLSSVSLQSV